jgi:ABC-2 type transport system permease protein
VLSGLGARIGPEAVIDQDQALPVTREEGGRSLVLPQPLYWSAAPENLSRTDLITENLRRGVHFGAPGAISLSPRVGVSVEPLARSSARSALVSPLAAVAESPRTLAQTAGDGANRVAAARIRDGEKLDVVILADIDVLNDGFYRNADGAPIADNSAFVLNALEVLAGDPALTDLRARAPAARPLTLVEELRGQAQARFLAEEERLQTRLAQTQERLQALEAKGAASGALSGAAVALSPDEQAALSAFREEAGAIRARLRAIAGEYRRAISGVETTLALLHIWLIPGLVAAFGFGLWAWRRRA